MTSNTGPKRREEHELENRRASEQWKRWLQGPGEVLSKHHVPQILFRHPHRWSDFLRNGAPHEQDPGPGFDWDIDHVTEEGAADILAMLETQLTLRERTSMGLYCSLMDRLNKWPDRQRRWAEWCSTASLQIAPRHAWMATRWEKEFQDHYDDCGSWPVVFSGSPAEQLCLCWLLSHERHFGLSVDEYQGPTDRWFISREQLVSALEFPRERSPYADPKYDWGEAKRRIEGVFRRRNLEIWWHTK